MRFGSRTIRSSVDEENPYWMSFSDVMAGLLVIFILASVVLILQLLLKQDELDESREAFEAEIEMLQRAEEVRRNILIEAAETLRERGIQVQISENQTVLRIPNELLGFNTGQDVIQERYEATAFEIGDVLHTLITRENRVDYLDTIFVEGHTDSRPFSGALCREKGNWCLSSLRAISLWQLWEQQLPENKRLNELTNLAGQPLFSVSGYAATRPVVKNEQTEEDFSQNRRIDIRFTIRRPSSDEYQRVRDQLVEAQ